MSNLNTHKKFIGLILMSVVVACVIAAWWVRSSRAQINDGVKVVSFSISGGTNPQALEFCLGVKGEFRGGPKRLGGHEY